ncbi:hypothetical protein [Amycolatopsis thermophila]|uniref:Uncharacterized protein n=1 Tax=Amycolatopsis thermophila TaxID=206084 RepID=A0ABU0EL88_9PSEU|nr:hypothetical protein [Amycolatopsis thermophila]MDQ0376050.1 hypothetical protein [Amycolatopsis thermophila]
MRRFPSVLLIGAASAAVVACGAKSPIPGEAPGDSSVEVTSTATGGTGGGPAPGTTGRGTTKGAAPGVPGSPIDYDSTVRVAGPESAQRAIRNELARICGPGRCGVTVRIVGSGKCVPDISPDPVRPGGTITITAGPCDQTGETGTEGSTSEESSSAGETTESGG